MKRRRLIVFMGVLVSFLTLSGCSEKSANGQNLPPPPSAAKKSRISFDEQWATFQKLGFVLDPRIVKATVEEFQKDRSIEEDPYRMLYMYLGGETSKEPWTPLTDRVWDFDTEAIEDHGAYVEIMRNLERISRGEMKFDSLKDYVDVEEGVAWVSFSVGGKSYKWDLKVDDDWVDPGLFTKVVEVTKALGTKGRYTYFNTGGQNAVIGYETPESRIAIVKATGLKIEWLN